MGEVAGEGRTVLFVSHNMQAIVALCDRVVWLNQGKVMMDGKTGDVAGNYINFGSENLAEARWNFDSAPGTDAARLKSLRICDKDGMVFNNFNLSESISIEMEFWVIKPGMQLNPSFQIFNQLGICLFAVTNFHDADWNNRDYEPGLYKSVCTIPGHLLNEGKHSISAIVARNKTEAHIRVETVSFTVHDDGLSRSGYTGGWIGVVRPVLPWMVSRIGSLPE